MTEYYIGLGREADDVAESRALERSLDRWAIVSEYYIPDESQQEETK